MDVSSGVSALLCRKSLAICILLGFMKRTNQGKQSKLEVRDNSNETLLLLPKTCMRADPFVQCYTLSQTTEKSTSTLKLHL